MRIGEWTSAVLILLPWMVLHSRARQNGIDRTSRWAKMDCDSYMNVHSVYKVGSLLYARVSLAHKDMEPELECFDAQTRKAEGFGELKGGFPVQCSLKMCRL